jgi:hypothetical protein
MIYFRVTVYGIAIMRVLHGKWTLRATYNT